MSDFSRFMQGRWCLGTIEHSGTHSALEALGWKFSGQGREVWPLSKENMARTENTVFQTHLYDREMPLLIDWVKRGGNLILTYRAEEDIRQSWLSGKYGERNLEHLTSQLNNYARLLQFNPVIFLMDLEKGITVVGEGAK